MHKAEKKKDGSRLWELTRSDTGTAASENISAVAEDVGRMLGCRSPVTKDLLLGIRMVVVVGASGGCGDSGEFPYHRSWRELATEGRTLDACVWEFNR
ncbi:uncharacterized protein [Physcomitrium patens]|uniref:uncharacterized protein isoform X2 n=1 Tax=Physcomitrium patens TaxID=3218 RepID=UPI003CCD83E6